MLNTFAKFLLVSTSMSPILGAIAVSQYSQHKPWISWGAWLIAALVLVLLCRAVLEYAGRNAQKHLFHIKEFERNDLEALTFLLTYLLPFVSSKTLFSGEWLTGAYVLGIIFLVISHAGAFHFNPIMGLLGFHFYAAKNGEGVPHILISKVVLNRVGKEIDAVKLAQNVYLGIGASDA